MSAVPTKTLPDAGVWKLDPNHTSVAFVARHLMIHKVRGTFGDVTGQVTIGDEPESSRVDVIIGVASIDTGAADRDAHLRSADFFDVEHFPAMRFVGSGVDRSGDGWALSGDLTIKDVTRPVVLDLTFEGVVQDPWGTPHAAFTARAEVDREDWGLTWNVALEAGGWLVSKTAVIEIEAEIVPAG
ncbi:MAG: polyisoprenoid-binding protein [Actinobacteria bacterium RBG_16_68_21]|nr:MAG: polyisoprenoid-binding protein [Actinobacteria bacterium RBG_16_68_21]